MALFEKVQRLSSEYHQELLGFYGEQGLFPLEVRNLLAQHVEASLCGDRCPDVNNVTEVAEFVSGIVRLLEERLNQQGDAIQFYLKLKLTTALQQIKEQAQLDPIPVFRRMQECLRFEVDLVKRAESGALLEQDVIMQNLNIVKKRLDATAELLKRMVQEQDSFEINFTEKQNLEDHLTSVQGVANPDEQTKNFEKSIQEGIVRKNTALESNLQQMMRLRNDFWEGMKGNIKTLNELQSQIFQEKLFVWKFQQQKSANGMVPVSPVCLERVQVYLQALAELLWRSRQQVQETERLKARNAVFNDAECDPSILLQDLFMLLSNLLNEAFLVEDQPPQVMKKGNKFATAPKVSLLVGNLNIQMSSPAPQVSTCIIREAQARSLSVSDKVELAMPIINGNATFEFSPSTKRLTAKFCNLQLKEIKRADRKGSATTGSESVMEEKLCLLFESWIQVGDLKFRVKTLSLPVVVTSHGSQDPTAEATIMWDNAFGQMGRIPFQVPNRVTWQELAPVISGKFFQVTGRALSEDNLRCLKQKAFRGNSQGEALTWAEFCKDNLPDRNFSFWHWIYAALKNIERKETYLKDLWKEGHLIGFVEREVAASMLSYCEPGTFMLRFSDSRPGAISISVVADDRSVFCIAPMDENDLKSKRLANSIRDLETLKYLYPGIPKDEAFGKYYATETQLTAQGYVQLLPSIPQATTRRMSNGSSIPIMISPSGQEGASPFDPLLLMSPHQAPQMYGGGTSSPASPMTSYSPNFNAFSGQATHGINPIDSSMDHSGQHSDFQLSEAMDELADILYDHQDLLEIPNVQQQPTPIPNTSATSPTQPQGTWTNLVQL